MEPVTKIQPVGKPTARPCEGERDWKTADLSVGQAHNVAP